jgi:O-antigen/teichoic acid export membrane protein
MSSATKPGAEQQQHIYSFNAIEMFFAGLIPLVLNILWIPLVTLITKGKYGDANSLQFLVLSACIPLLFFINLLWSLSFSAKKYKSVSTITIVCAVTNLVLNLVLISKFGGLGAAVAFFITIMLQGILYYRLVTKEIMRISLLPLGVFFAASVAIYLGVTRLHVHFMIQLLIGVVLYGLIAAISGQLNRQHIRNFKQLLSK